MIIADSAQRMLQIEVSAIAVANLFHHGVLTQRMRFSLSGVDNQSDPETPFGILWEIHDHQLFVSRLIMMPSSGSFVGVQFQILSRMCAIRGQYQGCAVAITISY